MSAEGKNKFLKKEEAEKLLKKEPEKKTRSAGEIREALYGKEEN